MSRPSRRSAEVARGKLREVQQIVKSEEGAHNNEWDSEKSSDSGDGRSSEDEGFEGQNRVNRSRPPKRPRSMSKSPKKEPSDTVSPAKSQNNSQRVTKKQKNQEKSVYMMRVIDIENGVPVIWRQDNYQLIQKYERKDPRSNSEYVRTQHYTGWICSEQWKYLEVQTTDVNRKAGKDESVSIRYPTDEEINAAKVEFAKHAEPGTISSIDVKPKVSAISGKSVGSSRNEVIKEHFDNYMQALLSHATNRGFLLALREDAGHFGPAIKEIERLRNQKMLHKLLQQRRMNEELRKTCETFWNIMEDGVNNEQNSKSKYRCKNCEGGNVRKKLIFEGYPYHRDSLLSRERVAEEEADIPLCVVHTLCLRCHEIVKTYHKLYHIKFLLFREACRRIALTKCDYPSKGFKELIITIMDGQRKWLDTIQGPYLQMWDKIDKNSI